jgi:hypothetical protein
LQVAGLARPLWGCNAILGSAAGSDVLVVEIRCPERRMAVGDAGSDGLMVANSNAGGAAGS